MAFFVYVLVSERDGSLYTGQTGNLRDRVAKHNKGLVKATKGKVPYRLVYFEEFVTRSEAMWREWEFKKKWNTERKKRLIQDFNPERIREVLGL
jgi:putative endonuclease